MSYTAQNDAVVAKMKIVSRHVAQGTDENHEKSVRIAVFWADIWNRDRLNMKYKNKCNNFCIDLKMTTF
jgi:hypothetical protein